MKNLIERIALICENEGITITALERNIGASKGVLSRALANKTDIQSKWLTAIVENYPLYDPSWLISGKGKMKINELVKNEKKANMIPFYDNVESVGGNNYVAEMNGIYETAEQIDAGDWFPNVTAAIRHYNDSMIEYPTGCVLALKKINDFQNIVWGSNYVIETKEMRITKRMQTSQDQDYIMAYSTNTETYSDGRQIHEPMTILKKDIINLFMVLGRIVNEHNAGPAYSKN